MEIKYKSGDTITIPEGCKASIKDGCVVFEKVQTFKDGDILVITTNKRRSDTFIYAGTNEEGSPYYHVGLDENGNIWVTEEHKYPWGDGNLSYATEEEKLLLFDKMKEQGLQWNAEEKKVEKIRWRAEDGKEYYYVGNQGILMVDTEDGYITDKNRYEFSNYFHTEKQAKEAIKRIKETLENYHNELGE